jgi:hypothetical protein
MESDGSEGKDEHSMEMDGDGRDAAFLIGDTALTPPSTASKKKIFHVKEGTRYRRPSALGPSTSAFSH